MGFFRPTGALIDLSAVRHNFDQVRSRLPKGVCILAMVKADAYGHGAVQVSHVLEKSGVTALGVATVEEGLELRESGIKSPIIVMGGLMGIGSPASGMMVGADLTPVVHSFEVLDLLDAVARAAGKNVGIHLKIDTGMSRLGILPRALPRFLERLEAFPQLQLVGVMTHLANAGDPEYTNYQAGQFEGCVRIIKEAIGTINVWHVANSMAVLNGGPIESGLARESWVRPGITLYGSLPEDDFKSPLDLRPVMSIKSRLALIKSVPKGTKVSYGCTFETERVTRLGVIPIGYADGYPWSLSNKSSVLIEGKRVRVIGCVTMDMVIVDVTDIKEAHIGSEVVLLGKQGGEEISALELSRLAGTIPYEIFCGVSKRLTKVFLDN